MHNIYDNIHSDKDKINLQPIGTCYLKCNQLFQILKFAIYLFQIYDEIL